MPPNMPAIMDLEASGFGVGSYPIEVGYVMPDGRSSCMLIRPQPDWVHWDQQAEQVHGIPRELLCERGHDPYEVALQLNRDLAGETLYTDAWSHDLSWLGRLFDAVGIVPRFRLESLRVILSEAQQRYWQSTYREVVEDLGLRRHRASSDAMLLQETFRRSWLKSTLAA